MAAASAMSDPVQQLLPLSWSVLSYSFSVKPTRSYPSRAKRAAVVELSTPPDMATATRVLAGGLSMPREFMEAI